MGPTHQQQQQSAAKDSRPERSQSFSSHSESGQWTHRASTPPPPPPPPPPLPTHSSSHLYYSPFILFYVILKSSPSLSSSWFLLSTDGFKSSVLRLLLLFCQAFVRSKRLVRTSRGSCDLASSLLSLPCMRLFSSPPPTPPLHAGVWGANSCIWKIVHISTGKILYDLVCGDFLGSSI